MPTFTTSIQHSIGSNETKKKKKKDIKGTQIGREEEKLSFYADDMILYRENHKDSTQKLPELFSKVADTRLTYRNWFSLY